MARASISTGRNSFSKAFPAPRDADRSQPPADRPSKTRPRLPQVHMIGESEPMLQVYEQTKLAAQSEATVVISGESGTGKELVALALHQLSKRAEGPFVAVNTAAMPASLLETELFGHVKGAYMGASGDHIGCFEAADGGTLFIDEIGELELSAQAKLLRTLETRRIKPIGSTEDRSVNVRVVAATNRSLEEMIENGTFRRDLYYRLNIITIFLPPLRERRSDIPLIVSFFLHDLCESLGREVPELDCELMEFIANHPWPGNVRQLRNCLESMLTISPGNRLKLKDLPRRLLLQQNGPRRAMIPVDMTLQELEKQAIHQALIHFAHDRTKTAQALGISVRTLQRKLKLWIS